MKRLTYNERAKRHPHPVAKRLLQLMADKQSNLSLSADVTKAADLVKLASAVGPEIVMLKTHIDIVEDFSDELIAELVALSQQHGFMLFEDRKFADIGHTVSLQYGKGIYKIADWADIVNAHTIPGPGIVSGLKQVGQPKGRALLLLAELSSAGHLMDKTYQAKTLELAKSHADFVIGFIAQHRLSESPDLLTLTPGVQLAGKGDGLGQQYVTPEMAVTNGADVIIVGRGIYQAANPAAEAKRYRQAGWEAYLAYSD